MPKYDFKCQRCGEKEELYVMTSEIDEVVCDKCKGIMKRLFSPQDISFHIRWGKPKVRQKVKRMGL